MVKSMEVVLRREGLDETKLKGLRWRIWMVWVTSEIRRSCLVARSISNRVFGGLLVNWRFLKCLSKQ